MAHKSVRLGHNEVPFNSKKEGIVELTKFINDNLENYNNGELFTLRYLDKGKIISCYVIINIVDDIATLTVPLNERDTLKIVESDESPEDTDVIWLNESEKTETERISENISSLRKELAELRYIVKRHEYAFTHEMNSGAISAQTDSTRETIMSEASPLAPEGYETYTYTPITDEDVIKTLLSAGTKFTKVTEIPTSPTADSEMYIKLDDIYYFLDVVEEEETEVDYPIYDTPNVKHLLIKSALTEEEIKENILNLCENELIWCVGNNSLYIRTISSSGVPKIVKITGNGGAIDTVVSGYTYSAITLAEADELISGGTVFTELSAIPSEITSDSKEYIKVGDTYYKLVKEETPISQDEIYVDENGVLVINSDNVTVDSDGYLVINISTANVENNILNIS